MSDLISQVDLSREDETNDGKFSGKFKKSHSFLCRLFNFLNDYKERSTKSLSLSEVFIIRADYLPEDLRASIILLTGFTHGPLEDRAAISCVHYLSAKTQWLDLQTDTGGRITERHFPTPYSTIN